MAETQNVTRFDPLEYYADAHKVFVIGRDTWVMCGTGRFDETEWVHIFTIRYGKVVSWRSLNDTARLRGAYQGEA